MHLFNPENDLALANFGINYTPPASAVKIADDLAILPVWYAPEGAKVIAATAQNEQFLSRLKDFFALEVSLIPFSGISLFPKEKIIPWGWNPALRKKLLDAGAMEESLPSMEELKQLRSDSGRKNAIHILNELRAENNAFCGESYFFSAVDDVLHFLHSRNGDHVLKMPNSGSGKGLSWIKGKITDKQTDWCRRVIHEQGGLIAEPVLNKIRDFAMEFCLSDNKAEFIGYSLFQSTSSGAYMGNFLMPQTDIEERLGEYTGPELLPQLRKSLAEKLCRQYPSHSGCLGVDMMVCKTNRGYQIQPCVEINLRMNMGIVAYILYDRFVKPGSTGKFTVDFFKKTGGALTFQQKMSTDFPLIVENGKIISGFLALTPVSEQTQYLAYVFVTSPSLLQNTGKTAE
ncbi:MAG TPA: hypothetical protein DD786_04030 [Porphyromonadaceae bacterium]|nr:hypothetical protein [Petrimonas sp.]HBQ56302.1 hypothetical protein [Porphyromonadaceae bacterium]